MYDTSDIRKGLKIMIDGAPYTVVEFQFVKPGKGAAFTRTKMKNLLTGGVLERNLRSGERLEPADVETKTMQYLYADADSFVFMDTTTYDQVQIPRDTVGDSANFMPENTNVEVLFFNGRAVDVTLPNFIEQAVVEADPGFRGDTATGATKPAKISTGASVNVPLFINVGDVIRDRHPHRAVPRAPEPRLAESAMPAATRVALEARARIVRGVRGWFEGEGFLEVATPARVRSPGQEIHLDAIPAGQIGGEAHWLITSPEYHLKRLVADGLSPIFEICTCWRAEESGPHHRTEFTMLEWYRANAPLEVLAADCEALIGVAFRAVGRDRSALGLGPPFTRTTVRELFERYAGFPLIGDETPAELRAAAERAGVDVGAAIGLGRHLLPAVPRSHRAGAGQVGADLRLRLAGAAGRAGAAAPV